MHARITRLIAILALFGTPAVALADNPPNYPANADGAKEFSWQKEWGSIHMNSFADGLNDPGVPATNAGDVPCPNVTGQQGQSSVCNTVSPPADGYSTISNGIKYDIKNSFLNCMSKAVPNWSSNNVWDSDINTYGPCTLGPAGVVSLENVNIANKDAKLIHDYTGPETKWSPAQKDLAMQVRGNVGRKYLIYQPVYDARANDDRSWLAQNFVGCQQQISNNCAYNEQGDMIRDVHSCVASPASGLISDGPGYMHPVSHVFSPQEVSDLKASAGLKDSDSMALPVVYYTYQSKDKDGKVRTALSAVDPMADPSKFPTMVTGSQVQKIDTSNPVNTADHFLSNLKSYRFDVKDGDVNTFVVMDPKDFFDLNLYIDGGKYAAGYKEFDSNKLVQTFNTCPVLGPSYGYGGICDPTGNAGCNLPIYGQSAETSFTDAQGNAFNYSHYPLKWSGYVKQWAVISTDKYLQNICGNQGCGAGNTDPKDREDYYIVDAQDGLNANPIFMVTRSNDYCETAEMTSNPREQARAGGPLKANMACIQYLQYQSWEDEDGVKQWSFVDLYNPVEAAYDSIPPEFDTAQLFNLDSRGYPDYSNPVTGTGPNRFISGVNSKSGNFVRFLDTVDPSGNGAPYVDANGVPAKIATYTDQNGNPVQAVVQTRVALQNTSGQNTTGVYLVGTDKNGNICDAGIGNTPGCTADPTKGTAIPVKPGTAAAIRMPSQVAVTGANGKTSLASCVVVTYTPADPTTGRKLFIPTNSQSEYQRFVTAASQTKVAKPEVTVTPCSSGYQSKGETLAQLAREGTGNQNNITDAYVDPKTNKAFKFNTWTGTLSCADVAKRPACNQVRMISAQRRCQLENGSLGRCGECAGVVDPDRPALSKFNFTDDQVGGAVLVSPTANANSCYFTASCFAQSSEGCPPSNVPGGHVFCLAPETKITMANGKEKAIKDVKAGDEVVAFNAKQTRSGSMGKAVVKATAITKKQEIIQINDLKITPLHKVVLASGRAVLAKEVKVGDKLLKANGQVEEVTKVKTNLKKITVYNLVLDKESDGYVAGGIRVMSYPLMKEMEVISGHANAAKPKRTRRVSSVQQSQ